MHRGSSVAATTELVGSKTRGIEKWLDRHSRAQRTSLRRCHEEALPIVPAEIDLSTKRKIVERIPVPTDQLRAWLPVHTYPISAGVRGGIAGSLAMSVLACAYGVLKTGSVWYPINLLAAVIYSESLKLGAAHLNFLSCRQSRDRLSSARPGLGSCRTTASSTHHGTFSELQRSHCYELDRSTPKANRCWRSNWSVTIGL